MSNPEGIRRLISIHKRRLQILKEQQALSGAFVDPRVSIEIEDIEQKIEELESQIADSVEETATKPPESQPVAVRSAGNRDEGALIFLSYARKDRVVVETIYRAIEEAGYRPWMDVYDIVGGEDWNSAIDRAIKKSSTFIACLSQNSSRRRGVLQIEINKALQRWDEMLPDDIYLIPLRMDDCEIPERLAYLNAIDWEDGRGKPKLIAAIEAALLRRRD